MIYYSDGTTSHEGAVLEYPVYTDRRGDYEGVAALVWDGVAVRLIRLGTVSYGSYWPAGSDTDAVTIKGIGVDATPETLKAVAAWREEERRIIAQSNEAFAAQQKCIYGDFERGDSVVVVRGRKIPKGTVAHVLRVSKQTGGVQLDYNGGTWTDKTNVSLRDRDEMLADARRRLESAHVALKAHRGEIVTEAT